MEFVQYDIIEYIQNRINQIIRQKIKLYITSKRKDNTCLNKQQQDKKNQPIVRQMLKSFIQLNLSSPHDKSQYQIKKNKLILLSNTAQLYQQCNNSSGYRILVSKMPMNNSNNSENSDRSVNRSSMTSTLSSVTNNSKHYGEFIKQQEEVVNFDYIGYDYKSMNQKILYQLLMVGNSSSGGGSGNNNKQQLTVLTKTLSQLPGTTNTTTTAGSNPFDPTTTTSSPIRLTVTFNYDIEYQKLQQFLIELMQIKKFQQSKFQIAHFQLRNNHVSDYNKAKPHTNSLLAKYSNNHDIDYGVENKRNNNTFESEQMELFTKQIDTCIKLDKTYNIKDNIRFKKFTKIDFKTKDVLNKNTRTNYEKKTNEFFILNIDEEYEVCLIIFHRQRDYVLTKIEEKEIEKAFVLYKGSKERGTVKLEFTTSLAQILQTFLNQSQLVIFLTQYPTSKHTYTLLQQLHMPRILDPNQPSSIDVIIQQYNKQKQSKLQIQMQKMKVKLRQIKHKRKTTQQNISYLMRKYKKGFENIFDSLNYLKKNNINDIKAYKDNLQIQIKQKQEDIRQTLEQLKEINYEMIQSAERSEYFMGRMEELKEALEQDLEDIEVDYQGMGKHVKSSEAKRKEQQKEGKGNQVSNGGDNISDKRETNSTTTHLKGTQKSRSNPTAKSQAQPQPSTSLDTEMASTTVLKKILQVEQCCNNPYQIQMRRQVEKYTNELRQNTRQRLIKSKQVQQFKIVMQQLRKRLTKSEFTKLQQKYLALISMC